jgi:hypothetical protein
MIQIFHHIRGLSDTLKCKKKTLFQCCNKSSHWLFSGIPEVQYKKMTRFKSTAQNDYRLGLSHFCHKWLVSQLRYQMYRINSSTLLWLYCLERTIHDPVNQCRWGLKTRAKGPSQTPQVKNFIGEILKFRASEKPFLGFWERFDRILMVRKQCYSLHMILKSAWFWKKRMIILANYCHIGERGCS